MVLEALIIMLPPLPVLPLVLTYVLAGGSLPLRTIPYGPVR